MRTPRSCEPLWIIAFDPKGKTFREQAFFCFPVLEEVDPIDEKLALEFLERLASSFKEVTEPLLEEAEADETKQAQAKEIRKKFKSIDLWIKWLKGREEPPSS